MFRILTRRPKTTAAATPTASPQAAASTRAAAPKLDADFEVIMSAARALVRLTRKPSLAIAGAG